MFSEAKVTEIYCMADDFCKEFTLQQEKYMFKESNHKHRNKLNRMNNVEIMVIPVLSNSGEFRYLGHYYKVHISVIPTQPFRSYPPSLFPIKWHLVANL